MITRTGGAWTHEYTCNSNDLTELQTKYVKANKDIPNGSTCLNMDGPDVYMYDLEEDTWKKL